MTISRGLGVVLALLLHRVLGSSANGDLPHHDCSVHAWVRAADLKPNFIAHGEIKVVATESCADAVKSIGLKLDFIETAEIQDTPRRDPEDNFGPFADSPFQDNRWGLEPQIYSIETRTGWTAQAALADRGDGEFDLRAGVVRPFSVAIPNINYPPGHDSKLHSWSHISADGSAHSQQIYIFPSYRYFAVVSFDNGTKEEIFAGYTTFRPHRNLPPDLSPSTIIAPEMNGKAFFFDPSRPCRPANISELTFNLTLSSGAVVRQGSTLEGEISFLSAGPAHLDPEAIATLSISLYEQNALSDPQLAGGSTHFMRSGNPTELRSDVDVTEATTSFWGLRRSEQMEPLALKLGQRGTFSLPISPRASQTFQYSHWNTSHRLAIMININPSDPDIQSGPGDGWELNECLFDRSTHSLHFSSHIPITVLGAEVPPQDTSEPPYYREVGDELLAPRIIGGHVQDTDAAVTFAPFTPTVTKTENGEEGLPCLKRNSTTPDNGWGCNIGRDFVGWTWQKLQAQRQSIASPLVIQSE